MPKRLTHIEFVNRLKIVNPNIKVLSEYNGNKNYITIQCLIDGNIWESKPNWLMKNLGCQCCYDRERGNKTKTDMNTFIIKSNMVHNDKYDYSKINYINSDTKVNIICPIHGDFWQTPNKHVNYKQGCPKCSNKNVTTNDFIDKANKIHFHKYDYSKVLYINNRIKVLIICPDHGGFWQMPEKHLSGNGCPICKESHLEREVSAILKQRNINVIREYNPKWLKTQKLDFYLPDYKIAIECQGVQHFIPVKYFGGESKLMITIQRDKKKWQLCQDNGVQMIYVIDENVKTKIYNDFYHFKNTYSIKRFNAIYLPSILK